MQRQHDIPKIFYSEETEQPFRACIDCDCDLSDGDVQYMVNKVVVRNEAVFEMAICMACHQNLASEVSQETQEAYEQFMFASAEVSRRVSMATEPDEHELEEWIDECMVCRKPRSECHRYSIAGLFFGSHMMLAELPAVLCDDCELQAGELTSKETRDRWDRFVEEHFDGPPGIEMDSPWTQPILL